MKYEFRTLEATDITPLCNIFNKIGIKEFQAVIERESVQKAVLKFFSKKTGKDAKENKENDYAAVGQAAADAALEVADIIFRNYPKAEIEIYRLLASVSKLSVDEIRHMAIIYFFNMIVDFVKKPEFGDFFKVVSKLLFK